MKVYFTDSSLPIRLSGTFYRSLTRSQFAGTPERCSSLANYLLAYPWRFELQQLQIRGIITCICSVMRPTRCAVTDNAKNNNT